MTRPMLVSFALVCLLTVAAAAADETAAAAAPSSASAPPAPGIQSHKPGDTLALGDRTVTVKAIDITPVVRNKYSERFKFDDYENPRLDQLRRQEGLEQVVAAGKTEFDKQVLLLDWVYNRFKKFGTPTSDARGAIDILKAVDEGNTFFCAHYADTLASCAAALGWTDRVIALRVGARAHGSGAPEHSATEIWSNQYRKWIFFDPTYAGYVERDGTPLSAWEVRQEWFYGDPNRLDFVVGKERKKYKASDMPIFRATHKGFGDLAWGPRSVDKLAFIGYIPNTNLMDSGPDYAKMFITQDATLAEGIKWHRRDIPADPATEPYFALDQADLRLAPSAGDPLTLDLALDTNTPNFLSWRWRVDGGEWQSTNPTSWKLHSGANTIEILPVNKFGVEGVPSKVVLEVK